MSDNLKDKVSQLGERLKIGGSGVGQKISAGMSSMSFKMKELFQGGNQIDKLVEEATAETLDGPDWATNLEICDMINRDRVNSVELIRSVKRRLILKSPMAQYLSLMLLETIVKNCDRAFAEVAAERVLDEMVRLIDDPHAAVSNRNKALVMIESWGESTNELRYLPIYEQTYKSLKTRGIRFPGRDNDSLAPIFTPQRSPNATLAQQLHREITAQSFSAEQIKEAFDVARNSIELLQTDELTITLLQQCRQSQYTVVAIIETAGDNEALLFEALSVNDEIQNVVSKYEEMKKPLVVPQEPEPAMIPVAIEPDDSPRGGGGKEEEEEEVLIRKPTNARNGFHGGNNYTNNNNNNENAMDGHDGNIFGSTSDTTKKQPHKDDLITF
ncbi:tom1-like protein 2 [Phtheirospermum japonicum]|uniref:Tom1-like protein 2 n=1 Tax=Phtheirospermum japonicum TaxID=374723 RepID=A0A830CNL7_9LAMI|nr:tom1-like protein 2 [Phtheirospermum japonicum]